MLLNAFAARQGEGVDRMGRKAVRGPLVGVLVLVVGTAMALAQASPVEQLGPNAWTNWQAGVIKAQGFGAPPTGAASDAQAMLMARRAAIVDAYRDLLEASLEVTVRSKTSVEQAGVKWDTVTAQVEGVVRNAAIMDEQQYGDGRYEVTLQMPLYGPNGLGQTVLPYVAPAAPPAPAAPALAPTIPPAPAAPPVLPAPVPPRITPTAPPKRPSLSPVPAPPPPGAPGPYTGLIVVVDGAHLDRSMSPAVLTPEGQVVYGRGWWKPGQISQELADDYGIVGYSASAGAPDSRAGSNPLIVHAVGVSGPPESDFKTDVIISDEDAAKIQAANAEGHFLDQLHVDIVVNP